MSGQSPDAAVVDLPPDVHIAVVAARFNAPIVDELLSGCLRRLAELRVDDSRLAVHRVPGAFELPVAARALAATRQYSAVICLGCVIQGDTPHFDYICQAVAYGITEAGLKTKKPVIFGVLTTLNREQALERTGGKLGNKGEEAAITALKMLNF